MKKLIGILSSILICSCLFNNCKNSYENKKAPALDTLTIVSVPPFYAPKIKCPSCNENATWKRYGNIGIVNTGWDGILVGERRDNLHLERDCGWKIYNGNAGGIGETYQVTNCNESVVLVWSYGDLSDIFLKQNWKGYFDDPSYGIKMGCSLDNFLKVYPRIRIYSSKYVDRIDPTLCADVDSDNSHSFVHAEFDKDKRLVDLWINLSL